MKKVILILGACVAVLTAMAQSPSYRVAGTAEGAADGDTVKMYYYKGWSVVPVAETVVKDGSFLFEGRQDTAVFARRRPEARAARKSSWRMATSKST